MNRENMVPVREREDTVAYLGVELPKATNTKNAPKKEQFEKNYINDRYSLEMQKKIAISFRGGDPILDEGGTSLGKTTRILKMCADLGWEVHYVNLNGATDVEDLMGRYVPNRERRSPTDPEYIFADGKVTSGLRQEEGKIKVVLLDEYGAAAPNIVIRLHEVLDALERGGEVVLAEDASEKLMVDKDKTKIVALTNPPGRGYLQREPLDPAQLRRWVYLKEANELPEDTLTHATRALFNLEQQTQTAPESSYLFANERALSPEQLKEIPGIKEILEKYLEFHKGAKGLLANRNIAKDQPQKFSFDDRMEPRRVRDFIMSFYRGDINETMQTALRYYYASKVLDHVDKEQLEELIRLVEYVPPVGASPRTPLEEEDSAGQGEPETIPGGITLEEAERIMGRENVLGYADVKRIFGVDRTDPIQFSRADLEKAKALGQMLVLRTDKTAEGKPMSLEVMNNRLVDKWRTAGKGELLATVEGWKGLIGDAYSKDAPRAGWALVSKNILSESLNKNYIRQTDILIEHLKKQVFKEATLPEKYRKAIATFESQKAELTRLMNDDWQEATKRLSELDINKLTRATFQEAIYDAAMYFDKNGERLLSDANTWTSSRSPGGGLVLVGRFGSKGLDGDRRTPRFTVSRLGVCLSRS